MLALVRGLPSDALVWANESSSWSMQLELSAVSVELLHAVCRLLMQQGGAKRARLPEPLRIPRPTDSTMTRRPSRPSFDPDKFTAYLQRLEAGQ